MKRCTKCGLSKPPAEFYAVKGGRDGLRGDCKDCHAARAKAWYAKNRVKAIANVKRWQQENDGGSPWPLRAAGVRLDDGLQVARDRLGEFHTCYSRWG